MKTSLIRNIILLFVALSFSGVFAQKKPELVVQSGHTAEVIGVTFSRDGRLIATAGDTTIKIWDAGTYAELRTINAHDVAVETVAFSADGKMLVSGGSSRADRSIKFWDVATGKILWSSKVDFPVSSIALSDDGRFLISAGIEIHVRDARSGLVLRTISPNLGGIASVAVSKDGAKVAAGIENSVFIWELASGTQLKKIRAHKTAVNSVDFSPDGKRLVSSANGAYPDVGDYIKVWNVTSGAESTKLSATNERVEAAAFSPDGKMIAAGSGQRQVYLWNAETGQQIGKVSKPSRSYLSGVNSLSFSPDSRHIVAGTQDNVAVVWDLQTREEVGVLTGEAHGVIAVAYSPDGKSLAFSSEDHLIRVWDLAAAGDIRTFAGVFIGVHSLAFSPDSSYILAGEIGGSIKKWNALTGQLVFTVKGHSDGVKKVTFSRDGKTFASASDDKLVKLWDAATGTEIRTFSGHNDRVRAVALSPDGKLIASSDSDRNADVKLWEIATGTELELKVAKKFLRGEIKDLAFSPDSKTLNSQSDDSVMSWDVATGVEKVVSQGFVGSVEALSIDREENVTALRVFDGQLRSFDIASGRELNSFKEFSGRIRSAALARNGKMAAVAADDKTVRMWDLVTGKQARILTTETDTVDAMGFSNDGKFLATDGDNYSIRLWNAESGAEIRSVKGHTHSLQSIAFAPDDSYFVAGYHDGTVQFFDTRSGAMLRQSVRNETKMYGAAPSIAFSHNGRSVAIGRGEAHIELIDATTGAQIRTLKTDTSPLATRTISALSFTLDDSKIIAAEEEGFSTWDVATGQRLYVTPMKEPPTRPAVQDAVPELYAKSNTKPMTVDGKLLFMIGTSGAIDVRDAGNGKRYARMVAFGEKDWAVVTDDGLLDGTSSAFRNLVWLLDANTFSPAPAEAFFNGFFRPGLLQDILSSRNIETPAQDLSEIDIRQPRTRLVDFETTGVAEGGSAVREKDVWVEVADNNNPKRRAGHAESSGAQDLRLFRNGSLVRKWTGDVFGKDSGCEQLSVKQGEPRRAICKARVSLIPGGNRFTAYAFNAQNVKSDDATAVVKGAESLKKEGTLYVFAVGVNKYAAPGHDLTYAVADANRIGDEVAKKQIDIKKYARTEVIKLTDQNATKANVMLALKRFSVDADVSQMPEPLKTELSKIKITGPEDAIVFHFSGHGTARCQLDAAGSRNCDRFYLLPHDGFPVGVPSNAPNYLDTMFTSSISDEDLEKAFEPIDAGNLLMIIDACNSGQALEAEEKRRGPMNSRGLAQLAYEKGMMILTASQSQQAALETSKLGHGLLTYSLVEGLKNAEKTADNVIIDRNWFDYASTLVPQLQLEEMRKSDFEVKNGTRDIGVNFSSDEGKGLASEKRLQSPRLFHRREADVNPFVVARP